MENFNKHFSFTSVGDVQKICTSLRERFSCNFFIYQRNFIEESNLKIKSTAFLCNDDKALKFILDLRKKKRESAKYDYESDNRQYVLLETTQPKFAKTLQEKFNFNNVLCRDERIKKDEWEHFIIGTSLSDRGIINYYMNNIDFLDNFVLFFRDVASDLIGESCRNLFTLERQFEKCNFSNMKCKDNASIILPKHICLQNFNGESIIINYSEIRCLILFCKGRTFKEIARTLKISPRTVESHIQNVKSRLNCISKSALFDILEKNHINNLEIYE